MFSLTVFQIILQSKILKKQPKMVFGFIIITYFFIKFCSAEQCHSKHKIRFTFSKRTASKMATSLLVYHYQYIVSISSHIPCLFLFFISDIAFSYMQML